MSIVTFLTLLTSLQNASILTADEKLRAVNRLERDSEGTQEKADINGGSIPERDLLGVFRDCKKLLIVACNIIVILPVAAFNTFLPLIIEGMDH